MARNTKIKQYKVGLVGCGRIASLLEDDPLRGKPATHAGAFAEHPRTRITSACDIDPERLERFGKRWGVSALYDDYRRLLDNEHPDIISVASWTETHSRIVVHAAQSGVKGIYCEKPIAVNLAQAKQMIKTCEENSTRMVIGHERRWDRRYGVIKEMLDEGKLGRLRSITGYCLSSSPPRLSRRKYGGGTLLHDGTHLVDLFNFFAGEPESVIGLEERPDGPGYIEKTALGIINYKNGVKGMIIGGGERRYFHFEMDIQTDTARVLLGNHVSKLYVSDKSERYTGFRELRPEPFPSGFEPVNPYVQGVDDLIREMETGDPSISGGRDGYKALEVILAIYRSAGKGGAPVKLA